MKVLSVYASFPEFYQPYMEDQAYYLSKSPDLDLHIYSLSSKNKNNLRYHFPSITFDHNSGPNIYRSLYYMMKQAERQRIILFNRKLSLFNHLELKLLQTDFDLIHIQQSYLIKMIPTLLTTKIKAKFIVAFRGGDTYVKPWINKEWREVYLKSIADNDVYCQVMSNNQKQYLMRWGIPEDNIAIISTGVNREVFIPAPYKKMNKVIQICSVFRFCWEKNVELNLRVIRGLKEKGILVKYHAFGDGPDLGQFFYWVDKLDLHDQVIYRGKVRPDELNEEFKNMDLILQMSASDALPTSVLEAQACGIPAIVSDTGGLPESLRQGETGFSLPYGDIETAVEKIIYLTDDSVYNNFRSKCISFIEKNFSTQVEVSKLLKMYRTILN